MARLSRRLESLLGGQWDELDETHLQRLIDERVREDFDLDYKAELYGNSEGAKHDLAVDIAKFANHQGGLLLLGVREDDDARAAALPCVTMSDDEEIRIRSIVAGNVFPHPAIDIRRVPREAAHGLYAIYVAPSRLAPHAVRRNDSLKYPVRNGSGTRYLTESDVADRYRARFSASQDRRLRLDAVAGEGLSAIRVAPPSKTTAPSDWDYGSWITVCLVPEVEGRAELDRAGLGTLEDWYREVVAGAMPTSQLNSAHGWRPTVGFRRFEVSDRNDHHAPSPLAQMWHSELHVDGSGYAAATIYQQPQRESNEIVVHESAIVSGVIMQLHLLSRFAVEVAGAAGDAVARVALELPPRQARLSRTSAAAHIGAPSPATPPVPSPIPVSQHSVALDDTAVIGRSLLAASRVFLADILSAFRVPEVSAISPYDDGLIARFIPGNDVRGWADRHGLVNA